MKTLLLLFSALLLQSTLFAQHEERILIKVDKNHKAVSKVYKYPHFLEGKVFFKNGKEGVSLLNYSLMLDEIHFINASRDTLALDRLNEVKFIKIGSDTFFYDDIRKSFYCLIDNYSGVQLVVQDVYKFSSFQKNIAYGQYGSTQASSSMTNIRTDGLTIDLEHDQYAQFIKKPRYFIQTNEGEYLDATKANFTVVFFKHENEVQNYIRKQKTNFDRVEDLKKLMMFCSSLK